jgi:hypothetical protein
MRYTQQVEVPVGRDRHPLRSAAANGAGTQTAAEL